MFDGDQLRGLQGQLQPFQGLADPLTVRRAVLSQMRYVADVASSLPNKAYSTSFCLGRLCRLIAVGHAVRHTKRENLQNVKQMPHSVAQLPEQLLPEPPEGRR